ncbi:DRMBL-domain-containing protein [Thozetella sp. PMI_491]|nr:DRMBL-domain-containing protein [Thozetella sp. PMI_491]
MAPSKATKTPRKPPVAKALPSGKKPQPNGSILTYFKKTELSLFIGDGQPLPGVPDDEAEDIYGADDGADEQRFNEAENSIKKRRLSPPGMEAAKAPPAANPPTSPLAAEAVERLPSPGPAPRGDEFGKHNLAPFHAASSPGARPSQPRRPAKRGFNNPFIDASDSEDEASTPPTRDPSRSPGEDAQPPPARFEPSTTRGLDAAADLPQPPEADRTESSDGPAPPVGPEAEEGDGGEEWEQFPEFDELELGDFDEDALAGEEYRAMRFLQEQARLEEEAGSYSCNDDPGPPTTDGAVIEGCPICGGSLAGATAEAATAHVNACLDGNPTPLPGAGAKAAPQTPAEVDAPEIGKRFARAAVPRPGQANPFTLGDAGGGADGTSAFAKMMSSHAEDEAWATAAAAEQASRGQPAYKRRCPFYKIMPGFLICVDAFRYGAVQDCKAYFLSHFHSDHYIGLTANWTHGPIYCSKVTGSLVRSQLKTAAQFVVELEFDEKVPVPGTSAYVTMIAANHCPGSSLFLFEKATGARTQRILHCGDFRACPAQVAHPLLRPETVDAVSGRIKQQRIDVCYLDTTYLNPRYAFPPQDDVIRACADLCVALNDGLRAEDETRWNALLRHKSAGGSDDVSKFFLGNKAGDGPPPAPANPDAFRALQQGNRGRLLVVCGTYSIGKERICKAIALALKTKIFASPAKIRICKQLGDPELAALLTSNPREAQVHMQMLMEIRAETLADYLSTYHADFGRIVGFRPSGWNYRPEGGRAINANLQPSALATTALLHGPAWRSRFGARDLVPQRGSGKDAMCFGVPYSEHSSFRELAMFLMALRIEKVVPTVNVGSEVNRKRMKAWTDRWLAERRKGGLVCVLQEDGGDGESQAARDEALWDGKSGKGGGIHW